MIQPPAADTECIGHFDAVKLLLDEWKFRQAHSWQVLERYGLAALAISVAPYTVQSLLPALGGNVYLFPIVGWVLSMWAVWLYGAEYEQCLPILVKYRQLLQPHYPPERRLTGPRAMYNPPIGYVTQVVLITVMTTLELLNGYLLWVIPKN